MCPWGLMFAASLKTLQKRTSELLKGGEAAACVPEDTCFSARDVLLTPPSEVEGFAALPNSVLVLYEVQNDSDRDKEGACFVLPPGDGGYITGAHVRAHFPVQGNFHFRFKVPTPDGSFGGYVWTDLNGDEDLVPAYRGGIAMRALRLPGEAAVACSRPGIVPSSSAATLSSTSRGMASPSASPVMSPSSSFANDLMEMGGGGSGPAAVSSRAPAPEAPPPPPVKMPDRNELVKARLAAEAAAVEAAVETMQKRTEVETQQKAAKVAASARLAEELDRWAKTADGQNWKDIRTLLSTLHTVIWPNSGWKELSLSELMANQSNVKKYYVRAILLAHADKQKDADADQQARADRIFQALNEAFKAA